jgi:type VI secretion system protein ImpL
MKAPTRPGLRALLALLGLIVAATLLWYVGPLVAVAGVAPLAGETARWAAIGVLVALVLARELGRALLAAHRSRRLLDGLVAGTPVGAAAGPTKKAGAAEVAQLSQRFEQAVATLRRTRLGAARRPAWLGALGGRATLDQLPWYILIGAPGAGKTTALINSGLDFPLATALGAPVVQGVGGTRNCDWWFTSEAVLLDTAGRYTTHDSDHAADRAAWFGFLDLLLRHRPRRPINGVLLTLSASDLLGAGPVQARAHAAVLRERIEELHAKLGIAFPIYVLVTKLDLLAGFMEFFADFDKDERAQVWGITFPYRDDSTRDGPGSRLASDFGALEKRLNERLLDQLRGENDRARRAAIFAFPQQWPVLRQALFEFLQSMLGELRAELKPCVRGVYFTSATQEGTPMDRALGGLVRALGLPGRALAPSHPSGKTFFMTRLLRDVVFAESGLAGTNLRWRRQRALIAGGLAGLGVCGAAAAGLLSWQAYADTRQRIAALDEQLPLLESTVAGAARTPATDLAALLPPLDALAALGPQAADTQAPNALQRSARTVGLDRSEMLLAAAGDSYERTLREAFLPRIAARLEQRLRAGEREHVELIYDTLKAYLMLFGGRNFDRAALRAYLIADWDATLPASVSSAQRDALRRHLDHLLGSGEVGAPSNADPKLIAQARTLVASVPLAQRAYQRLKQSGADAPPFSVESNGGAHAQRALVRASGEAASNAVPALYSRAVFEQALPERTREVLRQLVREQPWVLGRSEAGATDAAALAGEVRRLYLAEYASRWQQFLAGLRLAPATTLAAGAELAATLARPDSPLLALLRAAANETTLTPAAGAGDALGGRFTALRQYVSGQPAPIDATQSLLGKLATHLRTVEDALTRKALPPASDVAAELALAAERAPEPLRALLTQLSTTTTALLFAAVREPLSRQVAGEIAPACNRSVAARYPMQRNAAEEISREEFTRSFGAGGLFDDFVQRHLLAHLDIKGSTWSLRGAADRADGAEALQQFQRAQVIREAFFRDGGRRLGVRLDFRALELDPGIGEFLLEVDGQPLRFRRAGDAAQSLQWPGPGDGGRVLLQITPVGGSAGPGFTFAGPWALYRMLDRVRSEPGASPERTLLTFDVEGRKARFEVRSSGAANPMNRQLLEQFRCPGRL